MCGRSPRLEEEPRWVEEILRKEVRVEIAVNKVEWEGEL